MNNPAVLTVLLLLVLAVLVGNTLIAIAFLKGRGSNFRGVRGRDDQALEELHQRVQDLRRKEG
jgi:hypothetical protein